MTRRSIRLVRDGFAGAPPLDTAVSRAILAAVSDGRLPETLRVHTPGDVVAFGPTDRLSPGFSAAVAAARARGFEAIHRLAGGRAAVFHAGTIAFSWVVPDPDPRTGITRRFDEVADVVVAALRSLGVDARVGEVPGEYCPGSHSVSARGTCKLMGVGQRLVARAAHVGGVIVAEDARRVRDVLVPVYASLGLPFEPATVGAVEDEAPGVDRVAVESAVVAEFARRFDLVEASVDEEILVAARRLAPDHVAGEVAA